jgi:hypothetical protein
MAEGGGGRGGRVCTVNERTVSHFLRYRNARMPPPAANFLSEPLMKIALSAISAREGEVRQRREESLTGVRVKDGHWLMNTAKFRVIFD